MADTSRMKPDFAIYLDGSKIPPAAAAAVLGIRVYQTRNGASAFELVVSDPLLKWQSDPLFTDCKEVKIDLGPIGKLKTVFDGEVTAWRTELENKGHTVIVHRGMDRSHRLMRGTKTRTYADSTPLDCVSKIAGEAGLTAKTVGGSPDPVKMFRFQANESDFSYLRKMADLEGYQFWVDAKELHFERPTLSSSDDCTFKFGDEIKTFLPVANFRTPLAEVKIGAWDPEAKKEIEGKADKSKMLWTVPGGKPGADLAKFGSVKPKKSMVESQVASKAHADTVAAAILTRAAMGFLTAEVEVIGSPDVKPGAMVNLKQVGVFSGHYLVNEANHFYDAAGYATIFYVARDKWGDSSNDKEKQKQDTGGETPPKDQPDTDASGDGSGGSDAEKKFIDFTLEDDEGNALANVKCRISIPGKDPIEAKSDDSGNVHIDEVDDGNYTVELLDQGGPLTSIDITVINAADNRPMTGLSGSIEFGDGSSIDVITDALGNVHVDDAPEGEYLLKLEGSGDGSSDGSGDGSGGDSADGSGGGSG